MNLFSLALFAIMVAESCWAAIIIRRYSEHGDIETFLSRAPIDQVLRGHFHVGTAFAMFGLLTILRAVVQK